MRPPSIALLRSALVKLFRVVCRVGALAVRLSEYSKMVQLLPHIRNSSISQLEQSP
jgi:hypothetical protein